MTGRSLTILAFIVFLGAVLGVYFLKDTPTTADDEAAARAVVEAFGTKLKNISHLSDAAGVADALEREYGPYVTPALLAEWRTDPQGAPGRLTSSPYPDRIEISGVDRESGSRLVFEGDIVEVTNEGGGIGEEPTEAARRPIVLSVEKGADGWRIAQVKLGVYPGDGEWVLSPATSQGLRFLYPKQLPTTFVSAVAWPPLVERTANKYSCKTGPITAADGPLKVTEKRAMDDREYCVTHSEEGAAGSTYHSYEYAFPFGGAAYRIVFQLRLPQCANYSEPQQSACIAEQGNFRIDELVDRIAQSIRGE